MERSRPRVVMLVQNQVTGDSRVQKQARSAAEAGFEVLLLGRSPDAGIQTWKLGDAEVRLLPVKRIFDRRPYEMGRGWLRSPLAYPAGPIAEYRSRQVRAWREDIGLIMARQQVESEHRSPLDTRLRRAALLPRRAAVKTAGKWIGLRRRATRLLEQRRTRMDSPIDRLAVGFWQRAMGDRAWRRLDPALWDLEFGFSGAIDELEPDLIHANDFQMLGVGARAKLRARAEGRDVKLVWDVHEYLPGMRSWKKHPRWKPAQIAHEREYAPYADAVVTVSGGLADLLSERHRLSERPAVVMNIPASEQAPEDDEPVPSLRRQCGIGADVPLLVYSGAPLEQRGLRTVVEGLPALDGVHAAFVVSKPQWTYVKELQARAVELGVDDRVHVLPYVPYWQVVPFISEADAGVIPLHHWINHEIALINKFFEYTHARLPVVVSDVKTMAATVRETGQGEVFRAESTEDFVRAATAVLGDLERYRAAYDKGEPFESWTWASQAEELHATYRRVLND